MLTLFIVLIIETITGLTCMGCDVRDSQLSIYVSRLYRKADTYTDM